MLSITKTFVLPVRLSRFQERWALAWNALLTFVATVNAMALEWFRETWTRREEGMTIELDTIELDSPDTEILAVEGTDLLWIRQRSAPPPLPPGVARPRSQNLAPPDVDAFEQH